MFASPQITSVLLLTDFPIAHKTLVKSVQHTRFHVIYASFVLGKPRIRISNAYRTLTKCLVQKKEKAYKQTRYSPIIEIFCNVKCHGTESKYVNCPVEMILKVTRSPVGYVDKQPAPFVFEKH